MKSMASFRMTRRWPFDTFRVVTRTGVDSPPIYSALSNQVIDHGPEIRVVVPWAPKRTREVATFTPPLAGSRTVGEYASAVRLETRFYFCCTAPCRQPQRYDAANRCPSQQIETRHNWFFYALLDLGQHRGRIKPEIASSTQTQDLKCHGRERRLGEDSRNDERMACSEQVQFATLSTRSSERACSAYRMKDQPQATFGARWRSFSYWNLDAMYWIPMLRIAASSCVPTRCRHPLETMGRLDRS
jgi:hypothetical protein